MLAERNSNEAATSAVVATAVVAVVRGAAATTG